MYKYFGNSIIDASGVAFRRFGQELHVEPSVAIDILRGGGGIVPSKTFDEIFTREDIAFRRNRTVDNADYMERHRRALAASSDHLTELTTRSESHG